MQQTTARSARLEPNADRQPSPALSITLGVERTAFPRRHGSFRELILSIVSANEPAVHVQPVPLPASAEPALLLTEADFAPPDTLLPIFLRMAAFAALAVGVGGAAYFALSLLS